jgi:hypothetical protein
MNKLFQMAQQAMSKKSNIMEELLPMAEPMLMELIETYNKPETEGGFLQEGDNCVGITIMPYPDPKNKDKMKFSYLLVAYAFDEEKGTMAITKKAPLFKLNEANNG